MVAMMKKIANFLFEAGQLKRAPRNGWNHLGIKNPESIADHSWRTAVIAFILAKLEGVDVQKVTTMAVWHEIAETRIMDLDKLAQRYFTNKNEVEKIAFDEQMDSLPSEIATEIRSFYDNHDSDSTKEQIIVKDADYLECLIQAREYEEQGFIGARNWYENAQKMLKTESAKKLATQIIEGRPSDWFESLKRIER